MADYMGFEPFEGLTAEQAAAIETATMMAPPVMHDGLWRQVRANLDPAPPPWANPQVAGAIKRALNDNGIRSALDF